MIPEFVVPDLEGFEVHIYSSMISFDHRFVELKEQVNGEKSLSLFSQSVRATQPIAFVKM